MKTKDALILLAVGIGVYLIVKSLGKVAGAAGAAISSAQDALASGLYSLFGPNETGYNQYARIIFPDGTAHAIPTAIIGSTGIFTIPTPDQDPQGPGVTFTVPVETQYGGTTLQALKAADGSYQAFTPS